jgi:hypothetical protein
MGQTGLVNVGVPTELADQIAWLQTFNRLGIRGRNAFVAEAVREKIAATVHHLLEMAELERLQKGSPDLFDIESAGPWPRGRGAQAEADDQP